MEDYGTGIILLNINIPEESIVDRNTTDCCYRCQQGQGKHEWHIKRKILGV